ncbi:hypothetical protein BOTBODRAFT_35706 [Botryobasidium botryosum FD-172 SS1]|uniref:Peptidase M20 dimerisation domain-containing protein n=1 Tax=Botryobasidium botryosum (strain FD-172 SS1) TaxID=930990 RepID=A0A067M6G5_BOTB1|nr:hypothetical protein BOTBODRAFT_35706 [Botryobasidium botryosum FD-172 SS1]
MTSIPQSDPSINCSTSQCATPQPRLAHTLHQELSSVLSLAADERHFFSGSQGQDIYVWDRSTLQVKTTLQGHTGSVLALEIAKEKEWLFSSAGDSTVRIWSTRTLTPLYTITPHLDTDSGDIFSLVYSSTLNTLFFGCQNTSLQWVDLSNPQPTSSEGSPPRAHKFFDSFPQPAGRPLPQTRSGSPSPWLPRAGSPTLPTPPEPEPVQLQVPARNVVQSAHYGYIYCMALVPQDIEPTSPEWPAWSLHNSNSWRRDDKKEVQLVTGSGDEDVKLWVISSEDPTPQLEHTFRGCMGGVLSLVVSNGTIYAGCQDGQVKVWDLETRTLVRTIIAQENVDVLSLSMFDKDLFTCSANGCVQRWNAAFNCVSSWQAHSGIVLSSIITGNIAEPRKPGDFGRVEPGWTLVTGASDNDIKLWDIDRAVARHTAKVNFPEDTNTKLFNARTASDTLIYALSKFVSIPSVSSSEIHREDCRQAALWLKKALSQLGAEATLLPAPTEGVNPLVLGTFQGNQGKHRKPRPRVLFYGHYDVVSASPEGWATSPFTLTGLNGYLYGRGATDNKGPILAVACAASDLLSRRALDLDLIVLAEGEEENGSRGFAETLRKYKDQIGHVDAILVSNSYWLDDQTPCITYGLRGVVHSKIKVLNNEPDLHSGVHGGMIAEPMIDMVKLLATLSDGARALIPGFYDKVRPQSKEEDELYELLARVTQKPAESLTSRWREPSLTVHNIKVSGPGNDTVIPGSVEAEVSIRIVPDQDLETIANGLRDHVRSTFDKFNSPNKLEVSIDSTADWWLGELDSKWFKYMEKAIQDEWGVQPLRIREGGSIPTIPLLEKEFGCRALHLPMGQSTDQAHLQNERISLQNLRKGKSVIERFLLSISQPDPESAIQSPV